MARKWTIFLAAAAVTVLAVALLSQPALAAAAEANPSETGQNIGGLLRGIFTPLVLTIAGIIGIGAIVKRDYLLALMLVLLTMVVMGFFMSPSPYAPFFDWFLKHALKLGVIGIL
jgi:predicted lipid-binding transport protein (Tim44 family)